MVPYLTAFAGAAGAAALCKEFHAACFQDAKSREAAPMEEEEGEDLCNCEFSLAYGEWRGRGGGVRGAGVG